MKNWMNLSKLGLCLLIPLMVYVVGVKLGIFGLIFAVLAVGYLFSFYAKRGGWGYLTISLLFLLILLAVGKASLDVEETIVFPIRFRVNFGLAVATILYWLGWYLQNSIHLLNLKDRKEYDGAVVFAFGEYEGTNAYLILKLRNLLLEGIPTLTQKSLYDNVHPNSQRNCWVVDQKTKLISTYEIVKELVRITKRNNCRHILVVASKHHIWRCCRDLRRHGFICKPIPIKANYHKLDELWWVRNPFAWWSRELILRFLPFPIYKRVTTRS